MLETALPFVSITFLNDSELANNSDIGMRYGRVSPVIR